MNFDKLHLKQNIREIMKLYGLSEAEEVLMNHLLIMVQLLNLSPKLTLKLMQALTTCLEMSIETFERNGGKFTDD